MYLANANLIDEETTDVRSGFAAEGDRLIGIAARYSGG
jgi:hypothetical protein